MLIPGDVIVSNIPGAIATKRRPTVVVSTSVYQSNRPDVVVGVITTNISCANTPTDCVLQDWAAAGLVRPSAFRSYLVTMPQGAVRLIGKLSKPDWHRVQACLRVALAAT